ncbi:hypothetical protein TNCV_2540901, partial [Trichonephila clavipes]
YVKNAGFYVLTYYHNLLVTLYEAKHLVASSACTTHRKSGLPTWKQ